MTELSDGAVSLRPQESSVLVHGDPLAVAERPEIDATARLGSGRIVTADVRFGRLPAADDVADDVVLVGPAEAGSVGDVPVYTVAGPGDLTGYGVALTQVLGDVDDPLFVRIDSLTTLLQHVSADAAFRFIHVLCGRVDRETAVLAATVDPAAHDEQTIATITQPFDIAVTGDDGQRRIRRRG
ncbi:DUF7504 family protein [Salinigranum marinum]|uniref:DUF7504 family protein n=1 Tax=Salinigranum marinum TaxID=1515595 RepID=UPI00298A038A|nr:hypothetical protein [Salinigranum marinum]